MLDIMTLMASMQLQSEMKALRRETHGESSDSKPEPREPNAVEVFLEQAAATPLGEAVCQLASETSAALALESPVPEEGECVTAGWFDFPISIDLTVPKAPVKSA